jgi:chromosome segregation ATPase
MRTLKYVLAVAFLSVTAMAQQPASDSQLTQALLTEIRQLRQDLQVSVAVVQRAQILIYRLQVESGVLARATQRLDELRNRCSSYQSQVKSVNQQIDTLASRLSMQNPVEQKSLQETITRLKSNLALVSNEEQQCQPRISDAQIQVQNAQSRVDDLQGQLDTLDKLLATVGGK